MSQTEFIPDYQRYSDLIGEIYEASINPEHWPRTLKHICHLVNAQSAGLFIKDFETDITTSMYIYGFDADIMSRYPEFAHRDPAFPVMQPKPAGVVCNIFSTEEIHQSDPEYCQALLYPAKIHHQAGMNIYNDEEWIVGLAVNRNASGTSFEQGSLDAIALLWPHLQRAIRIQKELIRMRLNHQVMENTLEQLPWGVILLDEHGHCQYINPAAQDILATNSVISISDQSVSAVNKADQQQLQAAFNNLRDDRTEQSIQRILFSDKTDTQLYEITLLKLSLDNKHRLTKSALPSYMLSLQSQSASRPINHAHLKDRYGFTPAEMSIVQQLTEGKTLKQIANLNHVSLNTIKTQLRHIFRKTDVNRQAELVRLILR